MPNDRLSGNLPLALVQVSHQHHHPVKDLSSLYVHIDPYPYHIITYLVIPIGYQCSNNLIGFRIPLCSNSVSCLTFMRTILFIIVSKRLIAVRFPMVTGTSLVGVILYLRQLRWPSVSCSSNQQMIGSVIPALRSYQHDTL